MHYPEPEDHPQIASLAPPPEAASAAQGPGPGQLVLPLLAGLLGLGLALIGYVGQHHHPASAMRRWHAAMAAGDVVTLRADPRLGMEGWVASLEHELGMREYTRVLGIFDRVQRAGQAEVSRLIERVREGGRVAFEALPREQQRGLLSQSHREWVIEQGHALVPEAAGVGAWRVLLAPAPDDSLLQRLGTAALTPDEQSLLADRPAAHPEVAADPMLTALAARRTALGTAALGRIRQRVEREGELAFRREPHSTREEINLRSAREFMRQRGFASLSATDRGRVGTLAALEASGDALRDRLGRQTLAADEAREIAGNTRAAFVAAQQDFVSATGARLAAETLRGAFGQARHEVERFVVSGVGGRDLIRRQSARVELAWPVMGDTLRIEPQVVVLRWVPRRAEWRVAEVTWRPRTPAGGSPAATPVEAEAAAEEVVGEGAGQ